MNKLNITTGGHRLLNDDFMFMQAGLADAIKGLSSALGGNLILSGCKLSIDGAGPGWKLTEGYVSLGGEVYKVEATTYQSQPVSPVWVLSEVADAIDPILYADGNSNDVHLIRKVTVEAFASQPYISTYATTVINYGEDFQDFTLLNSWVGGPMPVSDPRYIKEGRWVSFVGDITYDGAFPAAALPFAQLPVGYRPQYNGFYPGVVGTSYSGNLLDGAGTVPVIGWIYIDTNGNCYADPNHISSGKGINLTSVRFRIA